MGENANKIMGDWKLGFIISKYKGICFKYATES